MILVDSSMWIDYFNGQNIPQVDILDRLLGTQPLAIGDLILVEILQGFRQDAGYTTAKQLLTSLTVFELLNINLVIQSVEHFCTLRKRGLTTRKTIDVIIATFCIAEQHTLIELLGNKIGFGTVVSRFSFSLCCIQIEVP